MKYHILGIMLIAVGLYKACRWYRTDRFRTTPGCDTVFGGFDTLMEVAVGGYLLS